MTGLRAGGYFRVSDESQIDNYSLDAQERAFVRWLQASGNVDAGRYRDEGKSAYRQSLKRTDFQRLLSDVRARKLDVVWVAFSSRFFRDSSQSDDVLDEFDRLGVKYVVGDQLIDRSTPFGWGAYKFNSVVDELYSRIVADNTRRGLREKAAQGQWVGTVPFGYFRNAVGDLEPSADADGVRLAFQMYATGQYSDMTIADELNRRGYQSRARTGERRQFGREAVRCILQSRAYLGYVSAGGIEYQGTHAPLIAEELWQAVQAIRLERTTKHGKVITQNGGGGVLSGIIFCYACGKPMWYHYSLNTIYYRCAGINYRTCRAKMVRADRIEEAAMSVLRALQLPDEWREEILRRAERLIRQERAQATPDRAHIEEQLRRLGMVFADELISREEYTRRRDMLRAQLAQASPAPARLDLAAAAEQLSTMTAVVEQANREERRAILRRVFSHLYAEQNALKAMTPTGLYLPLIGVITCLFGVADGTRTHNNLNHNQALCH